MIAIEKKTHPLFLYMIISAAESILYVTHLQQEKKKTHKIK